MATAATIAEYDLVTLADQVGIQKRHEAETFDAFITRLRAGVAQFSPLLRQKLEAYIADRLWEIEQPMAS